MSAQVFFATISLTIAIGFLGYLIFQKFKISDVLLLIGLGIILGPVTKLVKAEILQPFGAFISALALVVILFEGGIGLRLRELAGGLARASLLSITGFIFTTILVGTIAYLFLKLDIMQAIFLGSVLGGTSSLVVIPIVQALKCPQRIKVILSLESAFTDVLVVVIALAFSAMLVTREFLLQPVLGGILGKFSIAVVIGLILGLVWLRALKLVQKQPYSYMLTMAFLLALYAGVEYVGGSGPMSILTVGVILGNWSAFSDMTIAQKSEFWNNMLRIQSEISFLVKSFFFVFMGLQVQASILKWQILLGSMLIAVAILGARYAALHITAIKDDEIKSNKRLLFLMMPRGLAAAVMASAPLTVYGFTGAEKVVWYTLIIIIITNIIATFAPRFIKK